MNKTSKLFFAFSLAIAPIIVSPSAVADVHDDIGYTLLSSELGGSLSDGDSITVSQVEAAAGSEENNDLAWLPDDNDPEFAGKNIINGSPTPPDQPLGHATSVGQKFYGLTISQSPGITTITGYDANSWIRDVLRHASGFLPVSSNDRVINHSWIGNGSSDGVNLEILSRADFLTSQNQMIAVYAPNNSSNGGTSADALMTAAFNGIRVGVSDGTHASADVNLGGFYVDNRANIELVVPTATTSSAAPHASSSVALLIDASNDNPQWSEETISAQSGLQYHSATAPEVIKAILMAGALRKLDNSTLYSFSDFGIPTSNLTANGLDSRYGAGQLNIYNSYQLLSGGEKAASEDGGIASLGYKGFDYNLAFGGADTTESIATYHLGIAEGSGELAVTLAWHLEVGAEGALFSTSTISLYDLNLRLVDISAENKIVATSNSVIDNTENLYFDVIQGHEYKIEVSSNGSFNWDYGIAWHAELEQTYSIPIPIKGLLLLSLILTGIRHLRTKQLQI